MAKKSHETTKNRHYTWQTTMKNTVPLVLIGLAALGGLVKCVQHDLKPIDQKIKAFDETPATYLGSQGTLSFFDIDGNKATTELVSEPYPYTDGIVKRFDANIQPGDTLLISEWKDLGYRWFEHIKQDKQNER